jgi:hypothetical protein
MRPTVRTVSLVVLLVTAHAAADEGGKTGAEAVAESSRQLAGHVFTPSSLVVSPFSNTAFGTNTLVGTGTATGTLYDLQGNNRGTRSYDLGVVGLAFDFQGRINPALAVRAHAIGGFYTGLDGKAILVAGANAQFAGGVGATLAQNFGKRLRAGFTFDANVEPQYSVLIANAIINSIRNGTIDTNDLFVVGKRVTFYPGGSVAYSPHPAVGLGAQVTALVSKRVSGETVDKTDTGVNVGLIGDVDLNQFTTWLPLSVFVVWHYQGISGVPVIRDWGGGVFYSPTRRLHLQLGLELYHRTNNLRPDVQRLEASVNIGNIILRYYW